MELPTWHVYCDHTTDVNALCFDLKGIRIWFSYRTPVAFRASRVRGGHLFICENCWGPTTGKHLNAIDGGNKEARLPRREFEAALELALKGEP